jgi:hypothetical protein
MLLLTNMDSQEILMSTSESCSVGFGRRVLAAERPDVYSIRLNGIRAPAERHVTQHSAPLEP